MYFEQIFVYTVQLNLIGSKTAGSSDLHNGETPDYSYVSSKRIDCCKIFNRHYCMATRKWSANVCRNFSTLFHDKSALKACIALRPLVRYHLKI